MTAPRESWYLTVLTVALALFTATEAPVWSAPLGNPLDISAHYDLPNGPYNAGHRGIDISSISGQPVTAPTSGLITFNGVVVDRPVLSIRVDDQTIVSFEPLESELATGDLVAQGDVIGTVSNGGHCQSECLHVGVRVNNEYVNPLRFFKRRPILLPWHDT